VSDQGVITAHTSGKTVVTVSLQGTSSVFSTVNVEVTLPVAVAPDIYKNVSLEVYPTPSSNNVTINFDGFSTPTTIHIFDLKGSLVFKTETHDTKIELAVREKLKTGVYMLRVFDQKKSMGRRLVVD
jgi:hypothetical protein